ncbi:MAG TPA: T9SS type A sorting domain-containing protein, partial [Gemmatimonadaceae bacterium]|nr:T9SS type A sorting domain-containing protein [Gemmatimonadaceae bacterium]
DGQLSFTFDRGAGSAFVDFTPDLYALNGGCPIIRNYDGIDALGGSAVRTHRYRSPTSGTLGAGAVVMNRNNAEAWNTIQMTHPWFDIRDTAGTPAATPPELSLLTKILGAVLPTPCLKSPQTTGTGPGDELDVPRTTSLHQNVPNPFNPTTQIRFDLAQSGKVSLRIYDVAGHLVRTLVDRELAAGRDHRVAWNGLDIHDRPVASGVYFYRLEAPGASETRKLVVMR